jgi:hypothetical protein
MLHRPCLAALAAALVLVAVQGLTAARCEAEDQAASPPAAGSAPTAALTPASAVPHQADPYTVSGVDVDVTASSAAEARDKAILEAQRKAFGVLFKRLAADGDTRIAPAVADADLQRMMQGFEIEHERGSAVRYVGTLSFKFRRKAVRSYMSGLGVRVIEPVSKPQAEPSVVGAASSSPTTATPAAAPAEGKPSVLLPVFQAGGHGSLWEERTAWRSAWEDFVAAGTSKLVVPPGELTDVADISAAEALAGTPAALAKVAGHYNAGDVVVATLTVVNQVDPAAGGEITLTRYGADGRSMGSAVLPATGTAGEAPTAFLARAAAAAAARLSSLSQTPPPPQENKLLVSVPVAGLSDWLEVRRRLTSNPMVISVDAVSLSQTRVEVNLRYRGDQDALRAVLDRDALTLAQAPSGWELYLKSSAQQATPATPAAPTALSTSAPSAPVPTPGSSMMPPVPAPMTASSSQRAAPRSPSEAPSEYYSPSDEPPSETGAEPAR